MDIDFRVNGQVNPPMRFLIIDDSITMRRIIANILARLGYPDVLHAANGREALDCLATEPVDVVITDWYMPEMNGLDFVKILRTTPETAHIPIVIVTANASSNDIRHALELGVKGYILKPFTVETMKDKIDTLMAQIQQDAPRAVEAPAAAAAVTEAQPEPGPEPAATAAPSEPEPLLEPEPDFDTPPELDVDSHQEAVSAHPELAADAARSPEAGPAVVA
jgi:two-component system, chemotaxis family, chemotaxis protein CheY